MDFKNIEIKDDKVIVKDVVNFQLDHVFKCGQCFRWDETESGTYIGVAFGKVIEVEKQEADLIIHNTSEEDFNRIWLNYFDLSRNYSDIKAVLSEDPLLNKAVVFGEGIRLLKQDPFEMMISFIISANNRIPMIKKEINLISKKWGQKLTYKGKDYYAFPSIEALNSASEEEIEKCGVGFRAKYIKDTVARINDNNNIDQMISGTDDQCHEMLKEYMGIGPKVADCIMLFSMGKYSAFPVDVWVKRAMQHFYLAPDVSLKKIRDFGRDKFKELSGFAQQYLFYYARENHILE
ncbi:DNA-3-methyladenine glycosylase family protein [Clostridium cellulovorans]|uniref:DNA-(apurinic or apyrimidinic site) lyase n=1 Tax=Clostridium cellulovorans (strain ATCC 35296 / DSM 3052 / OCM 3 / 743B) TaxID=573061 RepID=D9ST00_CLOC7|nr:DNA-3-methyladenine glycosylase [Clostridium cellulovorans]ADL52662.1 DNA-(apurinic or apyrimidinic site) lyase [Clostridium cellulovorans 743B]